MCKKENIISPQNEIMNLDQNFITVCCKNCGKMIIVKKESEYVVCSFCKSTIIVERDVLCEVPPEYSNLTPNEYYLLLAKENSFNPYLFPEDSPYYLEPNFEKNIKGHIGEEEENEEYNFKESGDEHLYQTVKKNETNIKTKYLGK